jgi:Fe-S-cluster-containing hydrogenase component 2
MIMTDEAGIVSKETLVCTPGYNIEEAKKKKGKVVLIECVENIPCNPCETVCPKGAISVGSPITILPQADIDKCSGCGLCVAICPGQAIFVIDFNRNDIEASLTFVYEFLPKPKTGDRVIAVNRKGEEICGAVVENVVESKRFDQSKVVTIVFPKEHAEVVRGIRTKRR